MQTGGVAALHAPVIHSLRFPVLRTFDHRSLIFNSVPVYMADKSDLLSKNGIVMQHFIFTTESSREVDGVIEAYKNHSPTNNPKTRMR